MDYNDNRSNYDGDTCICGNLVLGLEDKKIFNFWGQAEESVFKPLYFRLVPFKCFQCLNK